MTQPKQHRRFEDLPGILRIAARTYYRAAGPGDGYIYETQAGALINRTPATDAAITAEFTEGSEALQATLATFNRNF